MNLRWTRSAGIVGIGGWILLTAILAYQCFTTAASEHKGWWVSLFLVFVALTAIATAVFLLEGRPENAGPWHAWLRPKPVAGLYAGSFFAFGTMMTIITAFAPTPAVEAHPGTLDRIEPWIAAIHRDTRPRAVKPPQIARHLQGRWGEPGCAVVYRFAITGGALAITRVRAAPTAPAFERVATIEKETDTSLSAVTDDQVFVSFDYLSNGLSEHLLWHDGTRPALRFDRCPV